jgi:hypothetical protein
MRLRKFLYLPDSSGNIEAKGAGFWLCQILVGIINTKISGSIFIEFYNKFFLARKNLQFP